jgi:hypothetical protein
MQSKPDESASIFRWIADALLNTKGAIYQLLNKLTVSAEKDLTDAAQTVHRCHIVYFSCQQINPSGFLY